MLLLVLCLLFLPYVLGGTQCPPRDTIYPCICLDRSIGKSKFHSTVICHGLSNGDSLTAIDSSLSGMEINLFLLYDSFWSTTTADPHRLQAEQRIPVNSVSRYRIEEVEVVDTILSNFGCPATDDNCRTNYVKKFTAINSSISDRASCNNNGITVNSWVSCPKYTEHLIINKGFTSDVYLRAEFFPEPMSNLKSLQMSYNGIVRIDRKTFTVTKFPVLETLDLSYNSLRDIKSIFTSPLKVKYLDLSHNSIRSLFDFQMLSHLHTLKINNNQIVSLLENEWQQAASTLRYIDLSNNNIQCNCATKWVNSTFHINAQFLGTCSSPPQVASMKIRRASRFLIERCDEDGNIGLKKPKPKKSKD